MAEQPPHDDSTTPAGTTRREVIRRAANLAGAATMGAVLPQGFAQAAPPLPNPASSGIDHIVVLMMENRSFDHMLGWAAWREWRAGGAHVHR
jgi:phospholipase C